MSDSFIPNLFVIGVPKAGTTSIYRWLGDHPDISASAVDEPRYLMDEGDPLARPEGYSRNGLSEYASFYPDAKSGRLGRHVLDVTPQYYYQETAKRVIAGLENKKVLMVVRNPAKRILSLFKYAQNNMSVVPPGMTFHDFVDEISLGEDSRLFADRPMLRHAIEHCHYAQYVEEWSELVGSENVEVLVFEELVRNPKMMLQTLANRLNIDPRFYNNYEFSRQNESYSVRLHWLHKAQRRSKASMPNWVRRGLKPVYNSLNTKALDQSFSDADRDALRSLDSDFAGWNRRLSSVLGRSGGIWMDA